jgi:hypothetical protein
MQGLKSDSHKDLFNALLPFTQLPRPTDDNPPPAAAVKAEEKATSPESTDLSNRPDAADSVCDPAPAWQ